MPACGADSLGYGADAVQLRVLLSDRPIKLDTQSGLYFCFAAPTRASVDTFHANGPPPEAATTVRRALEQTTDLITTPVTRSIPTGIASKHIAPGSARPQSPPGVATKEQPMQRRERACLQSL
jgi:hypothetical protein